MSVDVINEVAAKFPPANEKEMETFLGIVSLWGAHIPNYNLSVSPLCQVTWKKNDFKWGSEQQQAFEQIK